VLFRTFAPVQSVRSLYALTLKLSYPLSETTLRLQRGEGAQRSTIKEFSTEPYAHHEMLDREEHLDIRLRLPSTTVLSVKWRLAAPAAGKASAAQAVKAKAKGSAGSTEANGTRGEEEATQVVDQGPEEEPAQATVLQHALHSISEGVMHSEVSFKYVLDTEQSLSTAEIMVLGPARVTGVVAHGMQTWRASPISNVSLPGDGDGAVPRNGTLVHVSFKSTTMSKEAIIMVSTELDFDLSSGKVEPPLMVCRDVLRQTGTLAVVKVASVEVYEHALRGVARTGVAEVPSHIRGLTNQPIVAAYKFLSTSHSVVLSVLHHEEVPTLESVVDSALYQVLVLDTQRMMSLTMVLQNSQQQYMAVRDIPASAKFWSLRVNSLSTQPVRGRDGTLMVPLLVGTGGDANEGGVTPKTSVELAWMSNHEPLGGNGTLGLSPPRVDMPIAALSIEVQIPDFYQVNFTGTLQNVSIFSHKQPHAVNYQTERHVVEKGYKFGAPAPAPEQQRASVKAKIPRQGTRYRFEKILVVDDNARLSASYGARQPEPEPSPAEQWWRDVSERWR